MVQPLALVIYEKLLPGSKLVNRLQDLNYRTETLGSLEHLADEAAKCKPMVVFIDMQWVRGDAPSAIRELKGTAATGHLPIIAFGWDSSPELQSAAESAGATVVASEAALANHLPQLLDRALQLE